MTGIIGEIDIDKVNRFYHNSSYENTHISHDSKIIEFKNKHNTNTLLILQKYINDNVNMIENDLMQYYIKNKNTNYITFLHMDMSDDVALEIIHILRYKGYELEYEIIERNKINEMFKNELKIEFK